MMPTLQLKRGTTAQVSKYIPLAGELVYDSTSKIIYVGDGTTAGGFPVGAGTPASTADKLTTARTIGFSGITAAAQSFDGSANITFAVTAVPANLLTGTASINTTGSAAKLTTARAIALSGAVTGTANFDGSAAVTIATTLGDIDLGVIT